MNLDICVSGILVFFRLLTEVSIALAIAGVNETDRFYSVKTTAWQINTETSEGTTGEGTTTDLADRTNPVSYPDTSIQLPLTTKFYLEEEIFATQPYTDNSITSDGDLVTERVASGTLGPVRSTDGAPTETTKNDATTTSYNTESTTVPYTDSTTTPTTTSPYCPTDLEPKLIDATPTTISLMWLALKDPAGLYLVTVHSDGPAYEVPSYCSPDKGREEQMTTTEENITYSKALPKYTYNISITTTTSCGTPAEGSLFVTTLPSSEFLLLIIQFI
nr:unnamed protein product [Callosobruchus chinensis]